MLLPKRIKKKKTKKIKTPYQMKNEYEADKLIIAKLTTIPSIPKSEETTNQIFFFELINNNNEIKYREIFTGFITDCIEDIENKPVNVKYFDTPYVTEPEILTSILPEYKEKRIDKHRFKLIKKELNLSREKEKCYKK